MRDRRSRWAAVSTSTVVVLVLAIAMRSASRARPSIQESNTGSRPFPVSDASRVQGETAQEQEPVLVCRIESSRRRSAMAIGVSEDHEALAAAIRGWAERAGVRASAREALEGEESRPSWWSGLAEQGLLGLHVPEELGGSGAGGVELAVSVEELARSLAHGPSLPTVLASLLVTRADGTAAKELLPGLADGTTTAAVALSEGDLVATRTDDGLTVSGTVRPVVGAALADLLVLGAGDTWFVVDATSTTITPLTGLDAT